MSKRRQIQEKKLGGILSFIVSLAALMTIDGAAAAGNAVQSGETRDQPGTSETRSTTESGTPEGNADDAFFIRPTSKRRLRVALNVWVAHFGDYRHGTHTNTASCGLQSESGIPFWESQCTDTITEFTAFNSSSDEAKVRFQGLDASGNIVFERDTALPIGATRLLLPSKALIHGTDLGETFVVSSNVDLVLFGSSFLAVGSFRESNTGNEFEHSWKAASAKRQIDFLKMDCTKKDHDFACLTPIRRTRWSEWVFE